MCRELDGPPEGLAAELKIDGVSISLIYEEGRLTRGVTRGNGLVGDDVTFNVRTIRQLPMVVDDAPPMMEIRGEVFMSRRAFRELNRQREEAGEPPFANPRNAAAGAVRLLDPRITAQRKLDCFFYSLAAWDGEMPRAQDESLARLVHEELVDFDEALPRARVPENFHP